jgi:hypothetical protein
MSGGVHHWLKRISTREERKPVTRYDDDDDDDDNNNNNNRPRWPHGLRRRSAATLLLESQVRIPRRAWMFVSCVSMLCCPG